MKIRLLPLGVPTALAVIVTCALSGCVATSEESGWVTPEVDGQVPTFTAASSLPFDAYKLSDSKLAAMQLAQSRLLAECAENYGLQIEFGGDYIRPDDLSRSLTGDRLGTLTEAQAGQYGYHAIPGGTWAPVGGFYLKDASNLQATDPPNATEEQSALVAAVAYGPSTDPHLAQSKLATLPTDQAGNPVPEGGCFKLVDDRLGGPMASSVTLESDLMNLALAHPDVVKAMEQWSTCMKGEGYDYSNVQDASGSFGLTLLSPAEVKVAVADVNCTKSSRWADIFYFVLGDYERQALAKTPGELQDIFATQTSRLEALGVE